MPLSSEQARAIRAQGGGRQKGQLSARTKLLIKSKQLFTTRASKLSSKLFNAQSVLALGSYKIITITTDDLGMKHVETIRDEKRIENLLDTAELGVDYFIVVGALPDNKAADSILNRAWGKPAETLDVNVEHKFSLKDLAARRDAIRNPIKKSIDVTPVSEE